MKTIQSLDRDAKIERVSDKEAFKRVEIDVTDEYVPKKMWKESIRELKMMKENNVHVAKG